MAMHEPALYSPSSIMTIGICGCGRLVNAPFRPNRGGGGGGWTNGRVPTPNEPLRLNHILVSHMLEEVLTCPIASRTVLSAHFQAKFSFAENAFKR